MLKLLLSGGIIKNHIKGVIDGRGPFGSRGQGVLKPVGDGGEDFYKKPSNLQERYRPKRWKKWGNRITKKHPLGEEKGNLKGAQEGTPNPANL